MFQTEIGYCVCVYRSPSIPVSIGLDDLGQLLSKLLLVSRHVVLAGDLIIDMKSTCAATTNYQNLLSDFNLVQHVTGPSRVTDTSSTLIDHIVSTPIVSMLSVKQAIGLSDHCVQITDIDVVMQRPSVTFCWLRPFRRCCLDDVRGCLSSAPWSTMEIYDDPDDMWGFFVR